ncbi:hypothetical protein BG910_02760 [Neisseria chenwenguii]|uniref:Uncharacterized protein n=2 Tax=Neisseria chenwenguii TaxID=1853278 RepID=A0A220S078_9NEIS|nr:hypothetical protein [Neisseria chenwenguii]ASK26802.1 hypothetical protein BG910_02760 [Neisseria chenwenguii]ROV56779.1 hypothetical protein EGS38_02775 [Neisseria chenwenguii]
MLFAILFFLLTSAMLYYLLFEDREEFIECIKYCFKPDIMSAFQGKFWEDRWVETKILLWLGISLLVGMLVYINFK